MTLSFQKQTLPLAISQLSHYSLRLLPGNQTYSTLPLRGPDHSHVLPSPGTHFQGPLLFLTLHAVVPRGAQPGVALVAYLTFSAVVCTVCFSLGSRGLPHLLRG